MNRVAVTLMVATFVLIASCGPQKVDVEAERAQVKAVLDHYVTAVETEDMELYASHMTHEPMMMNFGGFGGPIVGWDALKETMEGQNAALSETKIKVSDLAIHVSEEGKLAWATCLWNLKAMMGENPIELPIRCTWVLEKRDNKWQIVHFHKSMAQAG